MANPPEISELAYEMSTLNLIKVPATWYDNKKAGIDWMQGFLKRHPEISIRQPEGCSISRSTSFNRHNVELFHKNINMVLSRSERFADGSRVYNLDETGTTTVQKPKKVLAAKGLKQVSQCTSGERGTLVKTCCIISASGNNLPPAMVFPRKNVKPHMLTGAPPGTIGLASPSGWMTGELFVSVMKNFVTYSGSTKENPTVLIFDNHESHLTIATLNLAKENGVMIVTLPPHCSNKLQPLDVSVFYSFKAHYNSAVDSWLLQNPGTPMTIFNIASCVGVAHERSMTPANIKSGFRKTGIYPFDSNVFTDSDFLPSYVTDRDCPTILQTNLQALPMNEGASCSTTSSTASPSESRSVTVEEDNCSPTGIGLDLLPEPDPTTMQTFISPAEFKGYPKAGDRKHTRKSRSKGVTCIATDTPVKDNFEMKSKEKEGKKNRKTIAKNLFGKGKTRPEQISSDEEDELFYQVEDSSDEEDSSVELLDPSGFELLDRDPDVNDFVLVKFAAKKDSYYIGKVLKIKDEDEDVEVTFMK